ncbi:MULTISPECIES: hypothetical protein [unclassified Streptomyces]|uniref:hypothetical protein n=1 Tax=unclassified Streptomyces TaxID=2593676 RepID=UPI0038132000
MPPGPPPVQIWGPPAPPAPAEPPDAARAAAVAALNLSGLGLGYLLVRRWLLAAVCWVATIVLLLVALPADPDGVPTGWLVLYVAVLIAAAAHGAVVGLRSRALIPRSPIALILGLVLLAVPAGGVVLYGDAKDEATEQMLLDRLDEADALVAKAGRTDFSSGRADYRRALRDYEDLRADHPGSRAAAKVPSRMRTYYTTVAAAYEDKDYCTAIAPLTYLRTVPDDLPSTDLGALEKWPDDRLATSLYECGSTGLAEDRSTWAAQFGELLTTFPDSEQAKKVQPAVSAAVDREAKGLGGDDPCRAVTRLRSLGTSIDGLPGEEAGLDATLTQQAGRATGSAAEGTYACGVDQYRDGDFSAAQTTMTEYAKTGKNAKNTARARKIAIGAEVAQTVPAAGKSLPTTRSGGSISVTVKNDSPDDITVLYTGPVTGSLTLKGCGSCKAYSFSSTILRGFKPCSGGKNYPQRTISLPVGTTYFVHKSKSASSSLSSSPASDTAKLEPGYIYTECAYTTTGLGSGL